MKNNILFTLLILCTCIGCNKSSFASEQNIPSINDKDTNVTTEYKECYQFDQRQCMTDTWADNFGLDLDAQKKATRMKSYLRSKGLQVTRVMVDMNFHPFTCEACDTCPYEHRFFVELSEKGKAAIEKLNLLNLSSCDCTRF